jgi:DNA-binding GntR family transcriptional regulator
MVQSAPKPPDSLGDYAIQVLRQDLVEGRLLPGTRVTAEEVAQRLSISHIPVREALRFLEAEGHLERDGRRGVLVTPLSLKECEQIYRLREILEVEALRLAVPRLTEQDFDEMERHVEDMVRAVRAGDTANFARANRAYHFVTFLPSETKWLLRFLGVIWDAAARYQSALFRDAGWEDRLRQDHIELLTAARKRDLDEIVRIMARHRAVTVEAVRTHGTTPQA